MMKRHFILVHVYEKKNQKFFKESVVFHKCEIADLIKTKELKRNLFCPYANDPDYELRIMQIIPNLEMIS